MFVVLATACLLPVAGCSMFQSNNHTALKPAAELPNIPQPADTMELEIMFIERPTGDPLIGNLLWRDVDQIGALEPEQLAMLKESGFRIGHISSSPPQALQTLLGMQAEIEEHDEQNPNSNKFSGRRLFLRSGAETEIQSSPFYRSCTIELPDELSTELTKDYENARCVIRMKVEKVQNGWMKIEFIPEIHHGHNHLRRIATKFGWQFQNTQKIDVLHKQKFSTTLNVGEMVVLTSNGTAPQSLGNTFFLGTEENSDLQRLLVIRFADMKKTESVYAGK